MSPASRAHLGLGRSFQDGRLFPSLTVAETIAVSFERHLEVKDPVGAALHLPFIADAEADTNQKVEALLELLGITDFRDKLGRELSTGSRRIVDLACVLAHNPSVLLLDEPSSGIAQREAEALGPLLAAHPRAHRRDAARDRARRAAAAVDLRPAHRARSRANRRERRTRRRRA